MHFRKTFIATAISGLALMALSACEQEGPAEKAGRALDEAASNVTESIKDTEKAIEEKIEAHQ